MQSLALRSTASDAPRQILTFRLGEEVFGVDILQVKEIRGWSAVTRVPHAPPHVLGVLNLRGAIVPVVDLRLRFRLATAEFTPTTVIIVISVSANGGVRDCGLVVDAVSDVVDIEGHMLRPVPQLSGSNCIECIQSLAVVGDRMLILLSADELLREEQDIAATTQGEAA